METAVKKERESVSHLAYLDGLRAIAALYVVLHHAMKTFDNQVQTASPFFKRLYQPFVYGHYSVDLFIVLSGFCLMLPVARNNGFLKGNALTFFRGRAKRILPPYFFAMAVSLLLIFTVIGTKTGSLWDWSIPISSTDILAHVFLIQDLFLSTASKINYVFWSISVEWRIYFLFPLFIFMYRKIGAITTTVAILIASFITLICLSFTDLNMKDYGINPQYLGLFAIGMLASYASFSDQPTARFLKSKMGWQTILTTLIISGAIIVLGKLLKQQQIIHDTFAIRDVISGLFLYSFLSWVALGKLPFIKQLLSWRPLAFAGTFAYSIYLIHAPLLQVVWQYIIQPLNLSLTASAAVLLIFGTLTITGISYLFFLVAERPFMKKKVKAEAQKIHSVSTDIVSLKADPYHQV